MPWSIPRTSRIVTAVCCCCLTLFGMYPFLEQLFADTGYQGPQFAMAVAQILPELIVEIVKRSDQASGFVVQPMRWVVERTLAWLDR